MLQEVRHALESLLGLGRDAGDIAVKGKPVLLVEDGRIRPEGMRESNLTENDLAEALRLQGRQPDPSGVRRAYLERNGTISVIPRQEAPRVVEVSVADGVQAVRIEVS